MATLLKPPRGVTLDASRLPKHVAIIMDGNRRWARARRLPAIEGHRRGIVALRDVTRAASDWGIPMLTVYGFSTENWKRDKTEISLLLDLCVYFAQNELQELDRNNVRVQIIGRYEQLPAASKDALDRLVAKTARNTGLVLNLAVNYSARSELRDAVARMMRDVQAGTLSVDAIEDDTLASYLSTAGMPDPDLLAHALFAESQTDAGIYHEVPQWGTMVDGGSPMWVGKELRDRYPGRIALYGAVSPWHKDPLEEIDRLVEEDQVGRTQQSDAQPEALLHALGVGSDPVALPPGQADKGHGALDLGLPARSGKPRQLTVDA